MQEKELRLALVCYGGVSLAVYMHGITKEIWRLARASRAFHAGESPGGGGEQVYHDLLAEIDRAGLRLRVLADIVAGASAGGLNGVFLAQAIATGQSLDPLTELWLASADIAALIDPDAAPRTRFSKLWALPLAWIAGRGTEASGDDASRDEVRDKLSRFVRSRWFEPPFGGARFTGLILDALDAMAAGPVGPRLLPPGQPLDLFVTVTDFVGHPERLELHSPPEVQETEHRLVIRFSDRGEAGRGFAHPAELAFAARATSSFPGAFPPFTVRELDGVLKQRRRSWASRRAFLRRVLPRQVAAGIADSTALIDGSVLANAPFRPAIEALRDRPARHEVDRRFVFIDPAPRRQTRAARAEGPPGFLQTILGAGSELPRQQPIRDNLEAITERSARIERLRGIARALRPVIEPVIFELFGSELASAHPTAAQLAAWRARAQRAAVEHAGYSEAAYRGLKRAGVVDGVAVLVVAVAGLTGPRGERLRARVAAALANEDEAETLRRFDVRFRIRRLRLIARRLGEMPPTAALAAMRTAVFDSLAPYLDRQRPDAHAALKPLIRADTHATLDALAGSMDLLRLDAETDARLTGALAGLSDAERRVALLVYLGFPFFDIATLPMLGGEGLDEFDPIKVDRISPDDATAIRAGGAEATLKGIQFSNFGAFFSRAYRENDYLWGRLHGAERLVDIIVSTLPPGAAMKAGRVAALKRALFHAILDEEAPRLEAVAPLIESLRREIG